MKWKKLGKIFEINENYKKDWMFSHSANPTALLLNDNVFRVFFSTRDVNNKSNVGFFDMEIEEKISILNVSNIPSLLHGGKGSIDEYGIGIGSLFNDGTNIFMSYMAWQIPKNKHWRGDIAIVKLSDDKQIFIPKSVSLLLGTDLQEDKISLSYPYIYYYEGNHYMWYGSTETWMHDNGEMIHTIKLAISKDLKIWQRLGTKLELQLGKAQAFSRPTVIKICDKYHMWFSYRGNKDKYKIGYAISKDLINWDSFYNQDNTIIVSDKGWDSEMVCYPCVFEFNNTLYMLYNGNGYGKTGIGLAVLEGELV